MSLLRRAVRCAAPGALMGVLLGVLVVVAAVHPCKLRAQLISPGKLSSPHAALEGIRNCTKCHELRRKGISPALCLECHEPLKARIDAGTGFHGTLPDVGCATCHKEHFGVDFALVRLDTLTFDHARTGFTLEGRHTDGSCRECHTPERIADPAVRAAKSDQGVLAGTFLGLPTACASCHESDSPHGAQFRGRVCTECHDTGGWKEAAGFDHDRAPFRLTGRHRAVACAQCHTSTPHPGGPAEVHYRGVRAGACSDCHEDQHRGAMPGRCETCHNTEGWQRIDRGRVEGSFNHGTTGFVLEGSHASAPCAACHEARRTATEAGIHIVFQAGTERRAFPRPDTRPGTCVACHEDLHGGEFSAWEAGGDCAGCHGQDAWLPAGFDVARHNGETRFTLEGAHVVVACSACHTSLAAPPDGMRTTTNAPASGDPSARGVVAAPDFHLAASTCSDCHQVTNPHGDQFEGRSCSACHTTSSFHITAFDHAVTRFPLDGAHARALCAACHRPVPDDQGVPVVRYRPLGTECRDCHGGNS